MFRSTACLLCLTAWPANAAIVSYQFEGEFYYGYDESGVFGTPTTDLAGEGMKVSYLIDTATNRSSDHWTGPYGEYSYDYVTASRDYLTGIYSQPIVGIEYEVRGATYALALPTDPVYFTGYAQVQNASYYGSDSFDISIYYDASADGDTEHVRSSSYIWAPASLRELDGSQYVANLGAPPLLPEDYWGSGSAWGDVYAYNGYDPDTGAYLVNFHGNYRITSFNGMVPVTLAAAEVPLPAAAGLLGSGLAGLLAFGVARRGRRVKG